jgi:hypothetical protein
MNAWEERGSEPMTRAQQKLLNAACGDLEQINWHGFRFSKEDWRHFLSGVILGCRIVPSVDMGEGPPGFIHMSRSSLELTKSNATDAITMAFYIGDDPASQNLTCKPVEWCHKVKLARGISESDDELAERYK